MGGKCYFCGKDCSDDYLCYGCGHYVCQECDQTQPFGSHTVDEHQEEAEK
jgi:hypothetical protein